ncbi:hypothetical protein [Methanolobus vulcani]|uniref:CRISPR-associated protein Csh1 n=1 Tax=Methanolobus vulcani TaxID=38026 RepID=A0A7Z8KPV6_9EURY|nr:hypothetical protein [Methanolobus vulcani]TQD24014.1 hypothetical protein FKV42_12515 [Methanolobus vulcani]
MYNFIVNLFSEDDYDALLNDETSDQKIGKTKALIVPPNISDEPFVIDPANLEDEFDQRPWLKVYGSKYFKSENFIRPTHNSSNNIGGNNALLSHSLTHYKITDAFIDKDENNKAVKYSNDNIVITIPHEKINNYKKSSAEIKLYAPFLYICDNVFNFFINFNNINPDNNFDLAQNDYVIFLSNEEDVNSYLDAVSSYTVDKLLKYKTFEDECDCCGLHDQLYMLSQGNLFDLQKDRKYLLRHPTRYKTNLKSKNPENFNVCGKCAKQTYNFFEYIKAYKFYRYVFPTSIGVTSNDYKDYSSKPLSILKMLNHLYNSNRFQAFDYVMMLTDPKIENIEFIYVSNFDYELHNEYSYNVEDLLIYSALKELPSKDKDGEITRIGNLRNKSIFLRELNLLFNNTLVGSLFETDPSKLIKSLHPFLKLKLIEYNSVICNYIYYQNNSLFEDKIFTKLFREILSETIRNSKFRDELKISSNKIRFFLIIYYKYLSMEQNGGDIITEYMSLKEKMDENDSFKIENDFEASYCMGQIFYYLLQVSKGQNTLELFTKYTMNVHDMEMLKSKLITVLEKYSHNEYLDGNRKFHNMMSGVLAFEFSKSYDNNKIPLYTGYFDNNYLYYSKKEGNETELQEESE